MPITANAPPGLQPPPPSAPDVLQVIAEDPQTLQEDLARAVEQIRGSAARGDRRGILLTRRSRSLFTVEPSTDVPFGATLERDRWNRRTAPAPAAQPSPERR